jgi:hypothetical protein
LKPRLVRFRLPHLALSWASLTSYVEGRFGDCALSRLFLSRPDFEALRREQNERDFKASLGAPHAKGPFCAPLLHRGIAIYDASPITKAK